MDFGIPAEEFYQLTPRQFDLLDTRYREHRAHTEMVGAFTTAAVINYSVNGPEKYISPIRFMPNSIVEQAPELTEEELENESNYNLKVLQMAAELKAQHGKSIH